MCVNALRATSSIAQIKTDTIKVAPKTTTEKPEVAQSLQKGDSLKSSGLSKNPVWEGVKLGAKQGAKDGLIIGPLAGAATVATMAVGISLLAEGKVNPLFLGGKAIAAGAGVGLVVGPVLTAYDYAKKGAEGGVAVAVGVERAKRTGQDESSSVKTTGQVLGAVSGAAKGAYRGFKHSGEFGVTSTQGKIAVAAAGALLGAGGGYMLGGYVAEKVYKVSK
ncbi:MAG: hypothetical protein U0457_16855 [Candidatus Sericytochromatia bacterium]